MRLISESKTCEDIIFPSNWFFGVIAANTVKELFRNTGLFLKAHVHSGCEYFFQCLNFSKFFLGGCCKVVRK